MVVYARPNQLRAAYEAKLTLNDNMQTRLNDLGHHPDSVLDPKRAEVAVRQSCG
jgi:hypothetical protein